MSEWSLDGKAALVVVHMQNAICKSPSPSDFMGHQRATLATGMAIAACRRASCW